MLARCGHKLGLLGLQDIAKSLLRMLGTLLNIRERRAGFQVDVLDDHCDTHIVWLLRLSEGHSSLFFIRFNSVG